MAHMSARGTNAKCRHMLAASFSQLDPLQTWEATVAVTLKVFFAIKRGHPLAGA